MNIETKIDLNKFPLCVTEEEFVKYVKSKEIFLRETLKEFTELFNRIIDVEKGGIESSLIMLDNVYGPSIKMIRGLTTVLKSYNQLTNQKNDFVIDFNFNKKEIAWELSATDGHRALYLREKQIPLTV